jgi:hypothetical protein
MIEMLRELFSFSVTESKHNKVKQYNFELVNCPLKEMMCKVHHSAINEKFLESEKYRKEKDFNSSIEILKIALNRTTELMEHPCTKCAQHFRSNIIEYLESIHGELEKMSKGFFGKRRHKSSCLKAYNVLKEFENKGIRNTIQIYDFKNKFLGNHLN